MAGLWTGQAHDDLPMCLGHMPMELHFTFGFTAMPRRRRSPPKKGIPPKKGKKGTPNKPGSKSGNTERAVVLSCV